MNDPHEKQVEVDAMANEAVDAIATDATVGTADLDDAMVSSHADEGLAVVQVSAQTEQDEQQPEKKTETSRHSSRSGSALCFGSDAFA